MNPAAAVLLVAPLLGRREQHGRLHLRLSSAASSHNPWASPLLCNGIRRYTFHGGGRAAAAAARQHGDRTAEARGARRSVRGLHHVYVLSGQFVPFRGAPGGETRARIHSVWSIKRRQCCSARAILVPSLREACSLSSPCEHGIFARLRVRVRARVRVRVRVRFRVSTGRSPLLG